MPKSFALHANERHSEGAWFSEWKSFYPIFVKEVQKIIGDLDEVSLDLMKLEKIQYR